jgi:hypothetical protein
MQALLAAIVTWLSVNYSLPANYDLPAIEFATPTEITKLRYGAFDQVGKVRFLRRLALSLLQVPRLSFRSIRTRIV